MQPEVALGNPFDRARVQRACELTAASILQRHEERLMQELAPYMKPHKKWWLFGPIIQRTKEQAMECLDSFTMLCLDITEKRWAIGVMRIAAVAKNMDGDLIYLTTEEFSQIADQY